jgi:hypothetical protein
VLVPALKLSPHTYPIDRRVIGHTTNGAMPMRYQRLRIRGCGREPRERVGGLLKKERTRVGRTTVVARERARTKTETASRVDARGHYNDERNRWMAP